MKITARGGTDGASIVLFWPANLPEDGDSLLRHDPINLVERLREEGKLIRFPCDADGDYTVSIYVRAPVPPELLELCKDPEGYPKLIVSGDGYFGGMEYMFKNDRRLLDRHPQMCEKLAIPDGTYSATVYESDVPEQLYERWLLDHAGSRAKRLWDWHATIAALAVASVPATLICFWLVPLVAWYCMVAGMLIICGSAIALSRTRAYKAVAKTQVEFESAYPAYVVHLE
jgi:hypothetical protein